MDSNNLFLTFFLIIFSLFFYKYFPALQLKRKAKLLIDNEFKKPQAFHQDPISIAGGICIFFSLIVLILNFLFFKNIFFSEYLSFCSLFFILGFLDDLKINISPKIRLFLMILILIILVTNNNFYLEKTGIEILNRWLKGSEIFSLVFICLCFLFIINGANLIDGYNGLLGIHSLIILANLFFINFFNQNYDLANLLLFSILILVLFLIFNFPKAKIFLGDSGSYLLGSFIAVSVIKTSFENPSISPFFFCILLFYLFFEVFFSFFRKIIKEKRTPLKPDSKHLHMLLYKIFLKKNYNKLKSNYNVSIVINAVYLTLIIPALFMMNNGLFCKYYSMLFFIFYIFAYKISYAKSK
jgi:UDP-GlcNAc:undecaprenyl-phosphate/decaprenyl-phosphate GlcNAc-1-phosphate transferase